MLCLCGSSTKTGLRGPDGLCVRQADVPDAITKIRCDTLDNHAKEEHCCRVVVSAIDGPFWPNRGKILGKHCCDYYGPPRTKACTCARSHSHTPWAPVLTWSVTDPRRIAELGMLQAGFSGRTATQLTLQKPNGHFADARWKGGRYRRYGEKHPRRPSAQTRPET